MTLIYIQNICIQSNPGATPVQGLLHQIRRVSLHDVSNPDLRQASFRRDSVELENRVWALGADVPHGVT
ncbi:MAG TPA: hypothetical protein DHW22_03630 [Planctomycetaceae bacterium]|nr:hypothetical protein [Planctomycetaceae bacterium]